MDQDQDSPLKDTGSTKPGIKDDDIAGHRTDNWQSQAMYIGLHFPQEKKHRHSRHQRDSVAKKDQLPAGTQPAMVMSPSQRIQTLLGEGEGGQSHDVFCELDELKTSGDGDMEWKETARWVKFEEDVEEGGERWSKPHVATLSLHSLFEVRKGIHSGSVMLDVEATDLVQITELVCDNMVANKLLDEAQREQVQDTILARHRHQHDKKHDSSKGLPVIRSLADIGKKNSERKMDDHLKPIPSSASIKKSGSSKNFDETSRGISETPSTVKFNEHFLKKIPAGAEASNILVGQVDFLSAPLISFVRLARGVMLGDLTEVAIPTRFIFILLGPRGNQKRFHEVGRSIATLMSDEVFHEVAYAAKSRDDLLAGIDEFLDQVTVLPPGEWDPTIRLQPPKSVPSMASRKTAPPPPPPVANGVAVFEKEEELDLEPHADPTLQRTGRLFGGLVNDIKRKWKWYPSDFRDALHIQSLAAFFFMYFASLTPIITFGGLLGAATDNNIAAMESLISGGLCGVTYHLFGGQPLTIVGSTGPVLVFETIVFNFCKENGLVYLSFRLWIGIWLSAFLFLIVVFDLSALVRYITRFTEESFAMLIALIFVVEAFKKQLHILDHNPVDLNPHEPKDYSCSCVPLNYTDGNFSDAGAIPELYNFNDTLFETATSYINTSFVDWDSVNKADCAKLNGTMVGTGCDTPHYVPDVFFFSCLLFFGTYVISMSLKFFRNARFFPNKVRSLVSDFAVFTAIMLMVLVDFLIGLDTPKLLVPKEFKPTRDDRGWLINPFANPVWTIPVTIAPALLATILIFMDQQITSVIVNRKEHKLLKGGGYHLDLLLITFHMLICSFIGTPWFVAATVLSINHVRSLTKETETSAPGERPKFLGVREQRVTGTTVFIMVGLSAFMAKALAFIPMSVLYGVFLYMGTSSLKGIQMVQRVMIMFMPTKYQPDYMYLRKVPLPRVHLFTAFQVGCLALLWVIKSIKSISIVFPLMVLAMCFIRKALDYVFTQYELKWLDDIMPEIRRREKEDKHKKKTQEEGVIEIKGGVVNIPLKEGKTISLPVEHLTINPAANEVNISEEMSRTAIWGQMFHDESQPQLQGYELRQRLPGSQGQGDDYSKVGNKGDLVRFSVDEGEEDALLPPPPEVVVVGSNNKPRKA